MKKYSLVRACQLFWFLLHIRDRRLEALQKQQRTFYYQGVGDSDEESLSVYGVDGTELRKYGRIQWNEYEIQLKSFDYNRSIELIVNKVK